MLKRKVLAVLLTIIIMVSSLGLTFSYAANEIPEMPIGNGDLYNENASFTNANVVGVAIANPLFTHGSGVLASTAKNFENGSVLNTAITGLSQAENPLDKTLVNIDTLTFVTKTKITIVDGATEGWQGASLVLRYDETTKNTLTLRYSPSYNLTQGCLRLIGYNQGGNTDYPVTEATSTNAHEITLTTVQTKGTIAAYVNDIFVFTYTIPVNSAYLNMPYAFGLNAVYSVSKLSETSLYFAERMDLPAAPEMPVGNENLYRANALFANSNVSDAPITSPLFTHSNGVLASTAKNFENGSVLNTTMSSQTQALKVDDNSMVNIDTLTFVSKTKLSITDGATENWQGASLVLRYDENTKNTLTLRYSPSYNLTQGCLRLVGYNKDGNADYPLTKATSTNAREIYLTTVQTKETIFAFVNDMLVFSYKVPANSAYLTMPYVFGLNSVYSVSRLSETNLYFAEQVNFLSVPAMPLGNADIYNKNAAFANSNLTGEIATTPLTTHSNGVLASTKKTFENGSVLRTAITGLTQMVNPSNNTKVSIDALTFVTKTKLSISDIGTEAWHGASILLRYNASTKSYLMLRYSQDGKLRITGLFGGNIDYLAETTTSQTNIINFAIIQTKNSITVYENDTIVLKYILPTTSNYLSMPYAFGLKAVYSISSLTETSLYFAERVNFIAIPAMPQGNKNLYEANANLYEANAYKNKNVGFTNKNGVLKSNSKLGENICIVDTAITGQAQVENPVDKAKININTLTFITRTTLTIEDIGKENWHGAGIALRYDTLTGLRLMLRYSKDGKLRITGFNIDKVDWLCETDVTISNSMNLTVIQTKNNITVYQNNDPVLFYTLPAKSIYLNIPYAFGLYVVNSVSKLTNSSVYFAERVNAIKRIIPIILSNEVPGMPKGNQNLYIKSAKFVNPSVMGLSEVDFINGNGSLRSTSTGGENLGIIETAISGKDKMKNPITDFDVNIKDLTFVTKSKLTIEDIGSEDWYGSGIALRFDKTQYNRLLLRYSQDGKLRITGDFNGTREYLAETGIAKAKVLNLAVVQTKNIIRVFSNNKLILHCALADNSNYLNMPYAFGLYSAYSVGTLTNTSMYFAERVDVSNKINNSPVNTGDKTGTANMILILIGAVCFGCILYRKKQKIKATSK